MPAPDAAHACTGFGPAAPIFRVRDLDASLDYYVNVLGFKIDWRDRVIASVSRDRCCIFLSVGDQGHSGVWVWIGIPDADSLHAEYRAKGAKVRHPPANYSWACEMQIEDPDGNVLRLGSEPKPGEPLGEWLDMHGNRWVPADGGGWRKVV